MTDQKKTCRECNQLKIGKKMDRMQKKAVVYKSRKKRREDH
jgi:hypothetical protein